MKPLICIFLLFLGLNLLNGQVLKVSVSIDYEHLHSDEQKYLENFSNVAEDYYNNFSWTEDEYETDIDVSIYIIVETVHQKSHERIYKAQFQIKSVSGEHFYDKEWEFPYQPGYSLLHNEVQFNPLSHFFDFYAYLVLAGELDTYGINLGTPYYDSALDIANRGILSRYSKGWSNRLQELLKITHIRTRPLREAKPDFFEAEYLLQEGNIKEARIYGFKVLDAIEKVIKEQPNNKYLRLFFDAHYRTFVEIFRSDNESLMRLERYDHDHREAYRDAVQKEED